MLEPECGSCLAQSCLPSFAFLGKCPHLPLHSRSSYREYHHQIVSPNPALCSEGFSQARQLEQLTLHAEDLPQSDNQAAAAGMAEEHNSPSPLTHCSHAPLFSLCTLPSSTIPALFSSRQLSSVSPAPPALTSGCSHLTSPLPCPLQARASIMLSCFSGECRCFSLAL